MQFVESVENKILKKCLDMGKSKEEVYRAAKIPRFKKNLNVNELQRLAILLNVNIIEFL
ncbi:TPA: hypothetical protein L3M66_004333 [Vibrio parahaemolyticus]|uniref:Uncharacterized protein n=1 Tax=Vibrio parahaemolyticus TaxID=670 RepID=A0A9Q3UJ40_VIBPH|nr:hypothetical protein [Vibrio parahaemolyticus]MCC3807700.1 hypothetical protein [Vibrio parahaemolyticus]HBN6205693.1 hypothetical protein [Vibrio parahaemolyticus]